VIHALLVTSGDTRCTCMTDLALDETPAAQLARVQTPAQTTSTTAGSTPRPTVLVKDADADGHAAAAGLNTGASSVDAGAPRSASRVAA
jgi:hypothetical protein